LTSSDTGQPEGTGPEAVVPVIPAAPVPAREPVPARDPALSEQSREDTDAGWGEYPDRADDRFHRDRPPHWDDF
jgi:hypothetical protein